VEQMIVTADIITVYYAKAYTQRTELGRRDLTKDVNIKSQ